LLKQQGSIVAVAIAVFFFLTADGNAGNSPSKSEVLCVSSIDVSGVWVIKELDLITGFIGGGTEYRVRLTKDGNEIDIERLDNIKKNGIPQYTEYYNIEFDERNLRAGGQHPEDGVLDMALQFNDDLTEAAGTISYSFAPPTRKVTATRSSAGVERRQETKMECLERKLEEFVEHAKQNERGLTDLQKKLVGAERRIEKAKDEAIEFGSEKEELVVRNSELTEQLDLSRRRESELQEDSGLIVMLKNRISSLKIELSGKDKQQAATKNKNKKLRSEIDRLQKSSGDIVSRFEKLSNDSSSFQDELDQREEQIDALQRNLQKEAARSKQLGKKTRKVVLDKEELNRKLLSANERIFSLEEQVERLKAASEDGGIKLINE